MAPEQQYNGHGGRDKERDRASFATPTNGPKDRVGPYILGVEIGKGSFATVYKGYIHVSLNRTIFLLLVLFP
jgi:hypothetical protein